MPSHGSSTARGYGAAHKRLRTKWMAHVRTGNATCWRCQQPIPADAQWDLGHSDDRTQWMGPEHIKCNRSTRKPPPPKQSTDTSRQW